jgi:hypothetical protein
VPLHLCTPGFITLVEILLLPVMAMKMKMMTMMFLNRKTWKGSILQVMILGNLPCFLTNRVVIVQEQDIKLMLLVPLTSNSSLKIIYRTIFCALVNGGISLVICYINIACGSTINNCNNLLLIGLELSDMERRALVQPEPQKINLDVVAPIDRTPLTISKSNYYHPASVEGIRFYNPRKYLFDRWTYMHIFYSSCCYH